MTQAVLWAHSIEDERLKLVALDDEADQVRPFFMPRRGVDMAHATIERYLTKMGIRVEENPHDEQSQLSDHVTVDVRPFFGC